MYACVHALKPSASDGDLLRLAGEFSPAVEETDADTVVFSISALRKLLGSPHQIASEICRLGYERHLQASMAITGNPDSSILLARNLIGVTLVTSGEESLKLSPLPLTCLFSNNVSANPELLQVLHRWGLKTCGDFAAIPERGISERLGPEGVYLLNLARGRINRPLRLAASETDYRERMELDHPVALLEPLLFLFARVLNELCQRLWSQSRAARWLETKFDLEGNKSYCCKLEFPVPLDDSQSILKLFQLHLERHSPEAPILAFAMQVEPAEPRRLQSSFFVPPMPPPDKLQITLERIAGMVGKENVGTPAMLNTHRPDAFEMTGLNTSPPDSKEPGENEKQTALRLVMRLFRPALHARVTLAGWAPKHVLASGVKGNVVQYAGPWKTSGEWWTSTAWTREEWDIALDDGALYRIYLQPQDREWFVCGVYD
jgi:protein ImuB